MWSGERLGLEKLEFQVRLGSGLTMERWRGQLGGLGGGGRVGTGDAVGVGDEDEMGLEGRRLRWSC